MGGVDGGADPLDSYVTSTVPEAVPAAGTTGASLWRVTTHLRRKLAFALAAAGLAATLSSCGFDYATDRPNTIAHGGYDWEGDVHVLATRIVSQSEGSGVLIATISTDADADEVQLTGVTGEGLTIGEVPSLSVPSHGMVNLVDEGGIPVSGDFTAGEVVELTFSFSNGEENEVDATVVTACHEYASITPAPQGGRTTAAAEEEHGETYSCEYPAMGEVGGEHH